ncbi:ABC transporter permease [Microbacterium sp. NEAU-LLC]|uniref:ABC transporter permease n=1 Tax=Microbacterium helvum TaxID=2773713 RepID=A0ABR8NN39_9MICO|nr:ABC transporter permease [Microbacterium helvum]MBD3940926.1 ABC transporter permease [Microbacterium helvum]
MSTLTAPPRVALSPTDGEVDAAASTLPSARSHRARAGWARVGRTAGSIAWKSAAIIGFLLLWEIGPQLAPASTQVFLPPLHQVLAAWWDLVTTGALQAHLAASLTRSVAGFSVAVVVGIVVGLVIAWYRPLGTFLTPLLEVFRNTAALALLPVFTLLLGIGEESKITIVAYAAFFPVLLNTVAGVRTVDPLLIRAARSLGLSQVALFRKVILPSAVPTIFTGIRMAGTASILVLIAAEMVGAKAGLGFLIVNAQSSFLIPAMYAGILTVAILGFLVNSGLVGVERRLSRWRTPAGH